MEQSPSESMKTALSPSMKALVADELLRHQDADVKVAVASCISEITRITAPDAPYEDDQMKVLEFCYFCYLIIFSFSFLISFHIMDKFSYYGFTGYLPVDCFVL